MGYSSTIREAALHKLCAPFKPALASVAREFGINSDTLRRWRDAHKSQEVNLVNSMRQQDWSLEERFHAVIETNSMSEEELGEYCRRQGLHSNTLSLWRENCLNAIRKKTDDEGKIQTLSKELTSVKKDLRRKDRALAEASARLVLKKKASQLWGTDTEDEEEDEDDL